MASTSWRNNIPKSILELRNNYQLPNAQHYKLVFENLSKTSISNYIVKKSSHYKYPVEKKIWWIVNIIAVIGMIYMIIDATIDFKKSPTVTTPEIARYPIQNVDFPGIAICNLNRMSRKAIYDFAEELLEFQTTEYVANVTKDELADMLASMGNLHLFSSPKYELEKLRTIHDILERGYNGYDVSRIMKRLTPKCRNMIRHCSWNGRDQSCNDIFYLRNTQDGLCCTFNYARRNGAFASKNEILYSTQRAERLKNIGPVNGLSLLLDPQLDDYTYSLVPVAGFKVLIFSAYDYPDVSSGNAAELLVPANSETFINLNVAKFYSVPDLIKYDVGERDCLFNTEQSTIYQGYYSYSDCIIYCRIADIIKLCKCIPFFYPPLDEKASVRTCNLIDLICLQKYKNKWRNVKPRIERNMVPYNEIRVTGKNSHLGCDCLPSCEDTIYTASVNSIPLKVSEITLGRTKFFLRNSSLVNIYFSKQATTRMRQDVLFYWYELLSNYGGICSLFLGLSIINVVELFYYLFSWHIIPPMPGEDVTKKRSKTPVVTVRTTLVQPINSEDRKLYWDEIAASLHHKWHRY